jgi:hypothetical protein
VNRPARSLGARASLARALVRVSPAVLLATFSLLSFRPADARAEAKAKDWRAAAAKVDDLVTAPLRKQKDVVVAPRCDDAEFLRRVHLDLVGVVPTEAEAAAFLNDPSPEKRVALVDRLLSSPRHGDWFATWYSNLLVGTAIRDRNLNRRTFNEWLRDQFARNRPYDQMVYDLVTASGNSDVNGAIGLMSSFERSAADAAGKTSRHFLGVQIQCAQCHDHPYDKRIKQTDFQAFAAFFFTTTHRRNQTPNNPEVSFDVMSYPKEDFVGAMRGGRSGAGAGMRPGAPLMLEAPVRGQRPGLYDVPDAKFLLGKTVKDVPGIDRRTILAKWMTSKNNEWFAPAFANRLWAFLLARGIVHPVDDFSQSNRPTNPELLSYLAAEFVRGDFDVHHLVRVIVHSETYQRSSKMPRDLERPDPSLYAVAPVKPLSIEQSFDSLFRVVGAEAQVEQRLGRPDAMGRRGMLVDPRMAIYQRFRRSFDDDEAGEDEQFTGTIPRGLMMLNDPQVNEMMRARPGTPLKAILDAERNDGERIRRIYLLVLSRQPTPGELSAARQHVHTSRSETEGYEDFLWALCNTTEFMSNH